MDHLAAAYCRFLGAATVFGDPRARVRAPPRVSRARMAMPAVCLQHDDARAHPDPHRRASHLDSVFASPGWSCTRLSRSRWRRSSSSRCAPGGASTCRAKVPCRLGTPGPRAQAIVLFALGPRSTPPRRRGVALALPLTPLTGGPWGHGCWARGSSPAHVAIENARERVDVACSATRPLAPFTRGGGSLPGHTRLEPARRGGLPRLPGRNDGPRSLRLVHSKRSQLQRECNALAGPVEPAHHRSHGHVQKGGRLGVGHAPQVHGRDNFALIVGQLGNSL